MDGPEDPLPVFGQGEDEHLGQLIRDACFTHLSREEHHECRKRVQNFAIGKISVREEVDLRLQEHMHLPAESLPGDHLRPEEQEEARFRLAQFVQAHPHRSFQSEPAVPMLDRFFENLAFLTRGGVFRGIAAFCVVLVLGNSVALAATEAVPGDTLYPVKVNVMEPARAMVTVTTAGRAEWASNCVKRRLAEAERLIARKELTSAHWAAIEESLDRHVSVAKRHINKLAQEDPESAADISVSLETTLIAHSAAISDVKEGDQDNEVLESVFDDVSSAASVASELTMDIEEQVSSTEEDMARIATRTIQSASSAVSDLDATIQADIAIQSNGRRVKAARSLLDDADAQLKAGQFKQSLNIARQAARRAEEGKAFLRMGLSIDVDADTSASSASLENSSASSAEAIAASSTSCSSSVYFPVSQQVIVPAAAEDTSSSKKTNHTSSSSSARSVSSSSSVAEQKSVSSSSDSSLSVESQTSVGVSLPVPIPVPVPLPSLPSLP